MAGVTFFSVYIIATVMMTGITFHCSVIMRLVVLITEREGTAVNLFYILIKIFTILFNMALITVQRPLAIFSMTLNAECMKGLRARKALMTPGTFFYPLFIIKLMMTCFALDTGVFMCAVRHLHMYCRFKGLFPPLRVRPGEIPVHLCYRNNISSACSVRAGNEMHNSRNCYKYES